MSTSGAPRPSIMVADRLVRPIIFEGCVGWLHLPPQGVTEKSLGVVLCSALGRDARCLYRPLRIFADQLAAAGYPTLRFDYPGEGDSRDLTPGLDALPEWLSAIEAAKAILRAETGVTALGIGGVRLGAAFAAMAAADCALLLLLAPVVDGKGWINKLQFAARHRKGGEPGAEPALAGMDADGMTLSAATLKSLSAINISRLPHVPPTVIVASNGLSTKAIEQHFTDFGAAVVKLPFEGLDDLFLDPNINVAPQGLYTAIVSRLEADTSAGVSRKAFPDPCGTAPLEASLPSPGADETPIIFGRDLFGVLCRPSPARRIPTGVLFLNTGGDPRAGIGRFAVKAARRLAGLGATSLRFDFAGVGDSPPPAPLESVHVYETDRTADLDAALAILRAEGCEQIFVVGISAGAYHALHAVLNDQRIAGAFCVSPLKLIWHPGDSLAIGERSWGKASVAYFQDMRQWRTWVRVLRGQVNVKMVFKTLSSRLLARLAPEADPPESQALRTLMAGAGARGARICLIMGTEDASLDEMEVHFGRRLKQLKRLPRTSLIVAPHIDHGLVYAASRRTVMSHFFIWLGFDVAADESEAAD